MAPRAVKQNQKIERQDHLVAKNENQIQTSSFPPTSITLDKETGERKRKRTPPQEPKPPSSPGLSEPLRKQPQSLLAHTAVEHKNIQKTTSATSHRKPNPVHYWVEKGSWPAEYFDPDDQTSGDFENQNGILWAPDMNLNHGLAKRKLVVPRSSKQSGDNSFAPTDNDATQREFKSAPYKRASYQAALASKGSFMKEFDKEISKAFRDLRRTLLYSEQVYPENSLFRDDIFETTCEKLCGRNEAMVIRDIALLLVPSAQTLATFGDTNLVHLAESTNEGWNSAEPLLGPRPQPDYSVGFGQSAFTDEQLEKLKPYVGEEPSSFTSSFMATWQMYFPFLACEVKCGNAAIDVADRQNAHSMTLAVRGVVKLFSLVKRQNELHRKIIAFSISHDHRSVRIYGHYPIIDGDEFTCYRHLIKAFDYTSEEGKDKWAAYRFTKNVYDKWMPTHLKNICSAIDELQPGVGTPTSQQSEAKKSEILQRLEAHIVADLPNQDVSILPEDDGGHSAPIGDATLETSVSEGVQEGAVKKPNNRARSS
ncbi:hypothetical protein GQ44DRAFT_819750 [Phaeosphaeriaceae sp. PMI808]|nr:hypothetical protein GQ44DRAFT_819750 [Phaeosphaeriaceae sp. PMI808]